MSSHPTLLKQFRSFCYENNATDIERAIEYFAVFGGMGWKVDMKTPLEKIIEKKILNNYRYIHAEITEVTDSNPNHHHILSALSTGDRREHSAFKKSRVSRAEGEKSIDFLVDKGFLICDKPLEEPVSMDEEATDKYLFVKPFLRFWFSSISPYYKGIKAGEYDEVMTHWQNIQHSFSDHIYARFVMALLQQRFIEDPIVRIGSYWDKSGEIELLAYTKSGKRIAGAFKYGKSKAGKSELTKLKEACAKAKLPADIYVIFSKSKFSNELKNEKGADLILLSPRNLKVLLEDLSRKDLIITKNKKY